jgi:hypothetical protein
LKLVNTFLFSTYTVACIDFVFLFGGLADGMAGFTGVLGLSVCINRGVCRPPPRKPPKTIPFKRFENVREYVEAELHPELAPALRRGTSNGHPL